MHIVDKCGQTNGARMNNDGYGTDYRPCLFIKIWPSVTLTV